MAVSWTTQCHTFATVRISFGHEHLLPYLPSSRHVRCRNQCKIPTEVKLKGWSRRRLRRQLWISREESYATGNVVHRCLIALLRAVVITMLIPIIDGLSDYSHCKNKTPILCLCDYEPDDTKEFVLSLRTRDYASTTTTPSTTVYISLNLDKRYIEYALLDSTIYRN